MWTSVMRKMSEDLAVTTPSSGTTTRMSRNVAASGTVAVTATPTGSMTSRNVRTCVLTVSVPIQVSLITDTPGHSQGKLMSFCNAYIHSGTLCLGR